MDFLRNFILAHVLWLFRCVSRKKTTLPTRCAVIHFFSQMHPKSHFAQLVVFTNLSSHLWFVPHLYLCWKQILEFIFLFSSLSTIPCSPVVSHPHLVESNRIVPTFSTFLSSLNKSPQWASPWHRSCGRNNRPPGQIYIFCRGGGWFVLRVAIWKFRAQITVFWTNTAKMRGFTNWYLSLRYVLFGATMCGSKKIGFFCRREQILLISGGFQRSLGHFEPHVENKIQEWHFK